MASVSVSGRNYTLSNDEELEWARSIRRSQRELSEASGRHRALLKRAKSEGIDLDDMKYAIKKLRIEPEDVVASERNKIHYMQLLGIGGLTADSIFVRDIEITEKTQQEEDLWEADDRGYRAGRSMVPMDDCPYDGGTEAYTVWTASWRKGQASIAVEMGPNARVASASRVHPGRRAKDEDTADAPPDVAAQAPAGKTRRGRSKNGTASPRGRRRGGAVEEGAVH